MAIFKCKICGGTLNIEEGSSVAVCEYCGTKQTMPRLDSEKKINLYDRADHFRRNNDYDKAMSIYESILNEDTTDAEAYWSILLCRYGVEYVEDPVTHRHVPTINRAQFTSVLADEDYKSAIHYADAAQREIYEQEAQYIDEVQKGILEISAKEEAFDVFVCYKETDANGRRTQDSVLATELYHGLTNEGFHVFFSRITLEDKLGTAYEPYIFAALNSAKVMVVIGTKPEYLNAVWVKNEWSRYLALIKSGAKKTLIPAYRDMDPYDLPEEFSHLQAQDGYAVTGLGECSDTEIVIPENHNGKPVVEISENAFTDVSWITSVIIPDTVTSIGRYAFKNCDSIKEVKIPDSITTIKAYAFTCCDSLQKLYLGTGLTFVDEGVFEDCGNLVEVHITDIGKYSAINFEIFASPFYENYYKAELFIDGKIAKDITIPGIVGIVGERAFENCLSITNVVIENGVTIINDYAFAECGGLVTVTIPASVVEIGYYAFAGKEGYHPRYNTKLEKIIYQGTRAQWMKIDKDLYWNEDNYSFIIQCTDGNID